MSGVTALGDVVTIKGGGTPSKSNPDFWSGDIPWVSPKDMKVWEIFDAEDRITEAAVSGSATNLIPANSILLVNRSGILKHTLPVGITRRPVAINQDIKALICSPAAYPEYIAYMLKAAEPIVLKWVRATTADNFPIDSLKELKIPLPPLNEQRRIAAILDKADALRRKRKHALKLLDGLTQSIFQTMTQSDQIATRKIGAFARVLGGKRLPKGHDYVPDETGFKYLRVTDLQGSRLNTSSLKNLAPETQMAIKRYTVREGDVVISIAGTIGLTRHIDKDLDGVNLTENAAKIVLNANAKVDPLYLSHALQSTSCQDAIRASTGQVTIGKLALFRIEELSVPLPPIQVQMAFRSSIDRIEKMREVLMMTSENTGALFASLQHRAFTGQL